MSCLLRGLKGNGKIISVKRLASGKCSASVKG